MTEKDYYVRGCTALLDAVGGAIHHIGNVHKYAREEDRPEKTLFVITTDGMENASRRYTYIAKTVSTAAFRPRMWETIAPGLILFSSMSLMVSTVSSGILPAVPTT